MGFTEGAHVTILLIQLYQDAQDLGFDEDTSVLERLSHFSQSDDILDYFNEHCLSTGLSVAAHYGVNTKGKSQRLETHATWILALQEGKKNLEQVV